MPVGVSSPCASLPRPPARPHRPHQAGLARAEARVVPARSGTGRFWRCSAGFQRRFPLLSRPLILAATGGGQWRCARALRGADGRRGARGAPRPAPPRPAPQGGAGAVGMLGRTCSAVGHWSACVRASPTSHDQCQAASIYGCKIALVRPTSPWCGRASSFEACTMGGICWPATVQASNLLARPHGGYQILLVRVPTRGGQSEAPERQRHHTPSLGVRRKYYY